MLQQPALTEEKRMDHARAITDASRRLASLITNILKLNKLENQQIYPLSRLMIWGSSCARVCWILRARGSRRSWRSRTTSKKA